MLLDLLSDAPATLETLLAGLGGEAGDGELASAVQSRLDELEFAGLVSRA